MARKCTRQILPQHSDREHLCPGDEREQRREKHESLDVGISHDVADQHEREGEEPDEGQQNPEVGDHGQWGGAISRDHVERMPDQGPETVVRAARTSRACISTGQAITRLVPTTATRRH